ncbi:universal stress protein [Massilia niastensis]|uniref:universal stress protein n=1 Tax=Massilia niastensis TaxID=544911 RepID=UPI00036D6A73|nr:universal stress protein [Massilia niastensis]
MFKTILVHVDRSSHAGGRMRYAAALAHAHGSHLIGAAMLGVARDILALDDLAAPRAERAAWLAQRTDDARLELSRFNEIAAKNHVSHEARLVHDRADNGLALLARFADLVVISQDDPTESPEYMATHLPEYVVLNCARPVLVVPRTNPSPARSDKVLLAWDGSKEASCAMSAALPMLSRAGAVTVVVLTGAQLDAAGFQAQQPELLGFLSRHGVGASVLVRDPKQDSGHELLALADELDCGVLVMGCYGHGRFQELCLGGASRTVLADAHIPLLLAH